MSQANVQPLTTADDSPPENTPENPDEPQGANLLLSRLTAAFPASGNAASEEPVESGPVSPFAGAALRQAKALQTLIEQIQGAEQTASVAILREEIPQLQQLLTGIAGEAKDAASGAQAKQESLIETMAAMGGHLASQRDDIQADKTAIQALTEEVRQMRAAAQTQAAENAQLRALIAASDATLQRELTGLKDSNATLAEAVGKITARLGRMQDDADGWKAGAASLNDHVEQMARRLALVEDGADALQENENALHNELGRVTRRLVGMEDGMQALSQGLRETAQTRDAVGALKSFSQQATQRLDQMAGGLASANGDMRALRQLAEEVAAGLRATDQAVDTLSRRSRILAELHQQAVSALQD